MPSTSPRPSSHQMLPRDSPGLQVLPIAHIRTTPQNPRAAADVALNDLVASLAVEHEPYLAQPPVVEAMADGGFRIIAGERRVRAVMVAGWNSLACVVYPRLDPAQAHELRLVENLHRQALDTLDEASALKIAWLTTNADALGVGDPARSILAVEQPAAATLAQLGNMLANAGFAPTRPPVTWNQVLDRLGVDLSTAQRKRRMRLLSLDAEVQQKARVLGLSAAAMRAVGTLQPGHQQRLITELQADPGLARKVRRIASTVNKGTYTLDEALDEAHGRVRLANELHQGARTETSALAMPEPDDSEPGDPDATPGAETAAGEPDQALIDAVMELINLASQVTSATSALTTALNGRALATLGEPWGPYAEYAISLIREANQELPA